MSPEKLFTPRSSVVRLERLEMVGGMPPESEQLMNTIEAKFGRDEKLRPWRVPSMETFKVSRVTLCEASQVMPSQEQRPEELVLSFHEDKRARLLFGNVDFHWRRVIASVEGAAAAAGDTRSSAVAHANINMGGILSEVIIVCKI